MDIVENRVVIIGGSVAGLVAAALFGEFANVLIIEKDLQPAELQIGRSGIPQDQHIHSMLEGGRVVMERYLPGFTETLISNGSRPIDRSNDVAWFHHNEWKLRYKDGGLVYLQPRAVIDQSLIACLVAKLHTKIEFQYGARVTGLLFDENRVSGVRLSNGVEIKCTLVVDAMGKCTTFPKLLQVTPKTVTDKINVSYSTLVFEFPEEVTFDADAYIVHPTETLNRGAVVNRINATAVANGTPGCSYVICTQFGYGEAARVHHETVEEFFNTLKTLPERIIYTLLQQGKAMTAKPSAYLFDKQVHRHWHSVEAMPDGAISVGDAVCCTDPVFGRGMAHAVMGINNLFPLASELVKGGRCAEARLVLFQQGVDPIPRDSFMFNVVNQFLFWVFRAQAHSPEVSRTLYRVAHYESSPLIMLNVMFIARVLWFGSIRQWVY